MDVPTLIREIKALSPEDRRRVLDAVGTEQLVDLNELLTEEQLRELERRLDLDDAGQLNGDSWDVVKARLRSRT